MAELEKMIVASEIYAYMLEMGIELEIAYAEKVLSNDIISYKEVLEVIESTPFATNH